MAEMIKKIKMMMTMAMVAMAMVKIAMTMAMPMPMTLRRTVRHEQRHQASPCTKFAHLAQPACQSGELPEILSENIKFKSIVVSSARQGHLDEGSYDPDAIGALGSPHVHNGRVETILHSALSRKKHYKKDRKYTFSHSS